LGYTVEDRTAWSEAEKLEVIARFHNTIVGHHGIVKTMAMIKGAEVHWKDMRKDVTAFIHNCAICQKIKWQKDESPSVSNHSLFGKYPMESLSIDTVGPLPEDAHGMKYIVVIVDNFSKFVGLFETKGATAMEYVGALLRWVGFFGLPKKIRTDGGPQFTATICQPLAELLKFEHLVIVPYHPEANGIVERRNLEVMKHLRALVLERRVKQDWSRYLSLVQRILNYTVDGSIGTQPARVLFGDTLPVEVGLDVRLDLPT
jgi:hypothetical protein